MFPRLGPRRRGRNARVSRSGLSQLRPQVEVDRLPGAARRTRTLARVAATRWVLDDHGRLRDTLVLARDRGQLVALDLGNERERLRDRAEVDHALRSAAWSLDAHVGIAGHARTTLAE